MALPADVATATVSGNIVTVLGGVDMPWGSTITFVPSVDQVSYPTSNTVVHLDPVEVTPDSLGDFSEVLVATDTPDSRPTDWTWAVKIQHPDEDYPYIFHCKIPAGAVEFADLIPEKRSGGVYITRGDDGDSAYEIAVANGFVGTEQQWLDSLVSPDAVKSVNSILPDVNGDVTLEVSSIEYVSGVVTLDMTGDPVRQFYTMGTATINGTEFPIYTPVVYFRMADEWVYKVVDLPKPPTVTELATYSDVPTGTTKSSFIFSAGGATVPEDGLLVASLTYWHTADPTVTVGGKTLSRGTGITSGVGTKPAIYTVPVVAGDSLDVDITAPNAYFLDVTLTLITGVNTVPYTTVSMTNATPFTVPLSPAGSIIIGQYGKRHLGTTAWDGAGAAQLSYLTHPSNHPDAPISDWSMLHSTGWAKSTGVEAQQIASAGGDHCAMVFARSDLQ